LFAIYSLPRVAPRATLFPYTTLFRSLSAPSVHPSHGNTPSLLPFLFLEGGHVAPDTATRDTASTTPFPRRRRRESGGLRSRGGRSEEHTSELQSREILVCRLLLE